MLGCLGFVVVVVVVVCVGFWLSRATERHVTLRVTGKDDQPTYSGKGSYSHQYLIFTDHGVFKDRDSLWFLKFDSSDLFAKLIQGHEYRCTTTGLRIPLLSTYRNLIDCTEMKR